MCRKWLLAKKRTHTQEREEIEHSPPREDPIDEMAENVEEGEEPEPDKAELEPEQVPENPTEGGDMATNVARAIEAAFNRLARGTNNHSEDRSHKIQQRFQSRKPPVFKADGEPIRASQWLTSIERVFKSMRLHDDELLIENATLCLQGEAGEWWESFDFIHFSFIYIYAFLES